LFFPIVLPCHHQTPSLSLQHHAATQALDAVKGRPVSDPKLVEALLYAADLASWSYCPTKEVREEE
jgi:hypothetical protein